MGAEPPSVKGLRLVQKLGAGGMGQVWLAEDQALGRRVAVKFVSERLGEDPDAHARFLREARAMATVEHPSIVRVYSFGEAEGRPYIVMEYVEGESLADRIRRGPLPPPEILGILREVVLALEAAWEKGLVHRDIKPSNILLDGKGRARVADFGLAKPKRSEGEASLTHTGYILGSPHYVSPEQARGKPVDFRTDVYSLGVVLFEALAGARPFEGATPVEVIDRQLHAPLPSLRERRPDTPDALVRLVEWMTRKEPSERPASYAVLLEALEGRAATPSGESIATVPKPIPLPPGQPPRRGDWLLAAAALALFLGILAASWRDLAPAPPVVETPAAEEPLVLAVTPFYGPDPESVREGRVMAALVEKEIARRFSAPDARVLGIEDTGRPVRDHAAARALGERLGAGIVVWGECFSLRGQSEVQPYFTLVPRKTAGPAAAVSRFGAAGLGEVERAAGALVLKAQAPDQIELRTRSVQEIGDLVLVLAGIHALYAEDRPEKALALFQQGPRTAESLRYQSEALRALARPGDALDALARAVALDPEDAQAHAWRGDMLLEAGRFGDAVSAYQKAAVSGRDYSTRQAILFEGKLYARETFESLKFSKGREDTGYLIARDPASGSVLERHLLPGRITSLRAASDTLHVSYLPSTAGGSGSIPFAHGRFLKPVFGGWPRLRKQGTRSGWALAANFLDDAPGPQREFALRTRHPDAPATLEALEAALRQAAAADPTQPWHLFFLGQALWARGEKAEAGRVWDGLFAPAFQEVPYFEHAAIAALFERFRQPDWADRAYAAALLARRRLPQPIGPTTLLEVLVNVPFLGLARDLAPDHDRMHVWLRRSRELGGTAAEGEAQVSALWARYYREKGDRARASEEEAYVRRALADPLNFDVIVGRFDQALYAYWAARAGFWTAALVLLVAGLRHARAGRGVLRTALGSIAPRERWALVLVFLVLVASWGLLSYRALDIVGLARMPVAVMDAMGGRFFVSESEALLAEKDTRARRFVAGVAHHLAGDVDRAQALYRSLPDDPRAEKNLEALGRGSLTPPEPITAADIRRAYTVFDWKTWLRGPREAFEMLNGIANRPIIPSGLLADACLLLVLAIGFALVPASGRPRLAAGRAERLFSALCPGAADLAAGRFWRGWLALTLAAFVVLVLAVHVLAPTSSPTPGIFAAENTTVNARPLPPFDLPKAWGVLHRDYWTLLWAFPDALPFWSAFVLAALTSGWLHVTGWRAARATSLDLTEEETRAASR